MVMSKRPPLDEWLSLFEATIAAEGITTLAGAAAGNSIIDGGLAGVGANSFISMLMVVYPGQPRLVDSMDITAFNNGNGEVTFSSAYKGVAAAIPAGVPYKIVTFRFVPAEVAALTAEVQTTTVAAGGGSVATLARLGLLIRWIADILNDAGVGLANILAGITAVFNRIGAPAGASVSVDILAIKTEEDLVKTQTDKLAGAAAVVGNSASINWNTETGTSGEAGEDFLSIGAAGVRNKINKLVIGIANLTAGAVVTVKLFELVNGVEIKTYSEGFVRQAQVQGSEPDGLRIISGAMVITGVLRVEIYSSTSEAKVISYDYEIEAM